MGKVKKSASEITCFVISPIGDKGSTTRKRSDDLLEYVINPVLKVFDLESIRADKMSSPCMITTQIIRHILEDRLVIADLTDQNPNVYYELALRHAFRKPVIQLIEEGQKLPFDVMGIRTLVYNLKEPKAFRDLEKDLKEAISTCLMEGGKIESPVTIAAKIEDLIKSEQSENSALFQTLIDQIEVANRKLSNMESQVCKIDDYKETIPPMIKDKIERILADYTNEISLLKSVKFAGVTGVFKRRENAIKAFARALDEENKEIMIIGSSLKGLLQKEEYAEIREKIKFKAGNAYTKVKFLLTHPIVADFRASQENRRYGEIGKEIVESLIILGKWKIPPEDVRLFLGTPTCFAIKTSRQMLINPYPYISVSFDSPCLHVEYSLDSGTESPGYFYDEFNSRHFGAWDSETSVHIDNFEKTIYHFQNNLSIYSNKVTEILEEGKAKIQ
jgi:hypothetical protein